MGLLCLKVSVVDVWVNVVVIYIIVDMRNVVVGKLFLDERVVYESVVDEWGIWFFFINVVMVKWFLRDRFVFYFL